MAWFSDLKRCAKECVAPAAAQLSELSVITAANVLPPFVRECSPQADPNIQLGIAHSGLALFSSIMRGVVDAAGRHLLTNPDGLPSEIVEQFRAWARSGVRLYHQAGLLALDSVSPPRASEKFADIEADISLVGMARAIELLEEGVPRGLRETGSRAALSRSRLHQSASEWEQQLRGILSSPGSLDGSFSPRSVHSPVEASISTRNGDEKIMCFRPWQAHILYSELYKAASIYGRVAVIAEFSDMDTTNEVFLVNALAVRIPEADIAVTMDGRTVIPLSAGWRAVMGDRTLHVDLLSPFAGALSEMFDEMRELVAEAAAGAIGRLFSREGVGTPEPVLQLIAEATERVRQKLALAQHDAMIKLTERSICMDLLRRVFAEYGDVLSGIVAENDKSLAPNLSVVSPGRLASPEREALCAVLSRMTEAHQYMPGDPRSWANGMAATKHPPELFEQLFVDGAKVVTYSDQKGEMLGFALYFNPSDAGIWRSRIPCRYDNYGSAAYIYFIVIDPENSAKLPVYQTITKALTILPEGADIVAGVVGEDNLRALMVHPIVGGFQVYSGDSFEIRAPQKGDALKRYCESTQMIGFVAPVSLAARKNLEETAMTKAESSQLARDLLTRRTPGLFRPNIQNVLIALNKAQWREIYFMSRSQVPELLDIVASSDPAVFRGLIEISPTAELHDYNMHLQDILREDHSVLHKLRSCLDTTLAPEQLRVLSDRRIWERFYAGEMPTGLVAEIREVIGPPDGKIPERYEVMYEIWPWMDRLVDQLNALCEGEYDFRTDAFHAGIDDWSKKAHTVLQKYWHKEADSPAPAMPRVKTKDFRRSE